MHLDLQAAVSNTRSAYRQFAIEKNRQVTCRGRFEGMTTSLSFYDQLTEYTLSTVLSYLLQCTSGQCVHSSCNSAVGG